MKRLMLLLMCSLVLLSCNRRLHTQTTVVALDSLYLTPEASAQLAKLGVTLTPISETHALLTQPAPRAGKTKYKNVGNTQMVDKSKSTVKDKAKTKAENIATEGATLVQEQKKGKDWKGWMLLVALACGALYLLYRFRF